MGFVGTHGTDYHSHYAHASSCIMQRRLVMHPRNGWIQRGWGLTKTMEDQAVQASDR